jgi:tRNA isopentenyl-2-thiomethyl-A-37 hydroxylase MiaE
MFIAALFTITKLNSQLRCPTDDEWIKENWMELEIIMLSELVEFKKLNIIYSCSFAEPKSKMMIMIMMMIVIMEHDYKKGTVCRD